VDRTERFYRIERLLRERGSISLADLMARLDVSRPTVVRDIAYLRDRMGVPIVFDRARNGYHLADRRESPRHRLPGLWFNADEIRALRVASRLLAHLEPSLLQAPLAPLEPRLRELLGDDAGACAEAALLERVCLRAPARRPVPEGAFQTVASALLQCRRLSLGYREPGIARLHGRQVSVQRLVHFQDNWFIDAWCHGDECARAIPLHAVASLSLLEATAVLLPPDEVARRFDPGYGAPLAGGDGMADVDSTLADPPPAQAVAARGAAARRVRLLFSPEVAGAVARGSWHPEQRMWLLEDGQLRLELPCEDPAQWLSLALQHGRHCEVLEPPALRLLVADELMAIARRYAELG
jgi:predicted DNA-binding transcriptional regulator YafY